MIAHIFLKQNSKFWKENRVENEQKKVSINKTQKQ